MTIAALWIAKGHVHCASKITVMCSNWDSSDSAVTLNGLDGLGLISDKPSDLWHPPSPLSKEKRGQSGRDEKPTTPTYFRCLEWLEHYLHAPYMPLCLVIVDTLYLPLHCGCSYI
jgi:hypothetical protein